MAIKATITGGAQARKNVKNNNVRSDINRESIRPNNLHSSNNEEVDSSIASVVRQCYNSVKRGNISVNSAAFIIVSELRHIYYSNCEKNGDKFDFHTFIYMDQLLFNELLALIESVISYGNSGISREVLKLVIKNCVESVEYTTDLNKMFEVIDCLYDTFA